MKVFSAAVALLASSAPAISAVESAKLRAQRAQQQQDDTDTAARNLVFGNPGAPEEPVGAEPFVLSYDDTTRQYLLRANCVCDTAEYSDPFELTEDLTIETKAFFDNQGQGFGGIINKKTSFLCTRLVRQGEGWIGLGINPGRPENDSELAPTFNPPNATKNAMQGSQAVIGTLADGDQPQAVLKYHLNGSGQRVVLLSGGQQTLVCPSITYNKKRDETTMIYGKYLQEDGEYEIKVNQNNTYVFAYGDTERDEGGSILAYHGPNNRGVFKSELPGPGAFALDPYIEILCAGGQRPCPKDSYQGDATEVPDRL